VEKWFRIWKNGLGCEKKNNVKETGLIIYQIKTTSEEILLLTEFSGFIHGLHKGDYKIINYSIHFLKLL